MWLKKDERTKLAFYYRETNAGSKRYSLKDASDHLKQINTRLRSLGLIKTQDPDARERLIELTPEGLQLGQKYNSFWSYIKLWYEEYIKNHPIWLIISFIGGVIATLLVNWLSSFFGAK